MFGKPGLLINDFDGSMTLMRFSIGHTYAALRTEC
jgi:hypothetical protein